MGRGRNSSAAVATGGFDDIFGASRGRGPDNYVGRPLATPDEREGAWVEDDLVRLFVDKDSKLVLHTEHQGAHEAGQLASAKLEARQADHGLFLQLENSRVSKPAGLSMAHVAGVADPAVVQRLLATALTARAMGSVGQAPLKLTRPDWTGSTEGKVEVFADRDQVRLELSASRGQAQQMVLAKGSAWAVASQVAQQAGG